MTKKIIFRETNLEYLHTVFGLESVDSLSQKHARLFPNGNTHKEIPTTAIFLASLSAIKEYREELLSKIGIHKIKQKNAALHTYTELSNIEKNNRPDGLIVITSGKTTPIIEWATFVEAKIGDSNIDENQINDYSTFAREIGIK